MNFGNFGAGAGQGFGGAMPQQQQQQQFGGQQQGNRSSQADTLNAFANMLGQMRANQQQQQQQAWDPSGYASTFTNLMGQMAGANQANQNASLQRDALAVPLYQQQLVNQGQQNLAQINNPWMMAATLGQQIGPTNSAAYNAYGNIGAQQVAQQGASDRLAAVLPLLQSLGASFGNMGGGGFVRGFQSTNTPQMASY